MWEVAPCAKYHKVVLRALAGTGDGLGRAVTGGDGRRARRGNGQGENFGRAARDHDGHYCHPLTFTLTSSITVVMNSMITVTKFFHHRKIKMRLCDCDTIIVIYTILCRHHDTIIHSHMDPHIWKFRILKLNLVCCNSI